MAENEKEEGIHLPGGVIEIILLRLPVKSLLRFKTVCKGWYTLITSIPFIKLHLGRSLATNDLRFLFKGSHFSSVALDSCEQQVAMELYHRFESPVQDMKVVGSCNGLLCISSSRRFEKIFFWNPSTRKQKKLPITPTGEDNFDSHFGFGYDTTSDDYKLVRIVQENYDHWKVLVYSLNTDSCRMIEYMPSQFYDFEPKFEFGFCANSTLYWVTRRPDVQSNSIISFHLEDEQFGEMPLPDFAEKGDFFTMGILGGQLCLHIQFFGTKLVGRVGFMNRIELWVMNVPDSWTKQSLIEFPWMGPAPHLVCYSKNGEIIFRRLAVLADRRIVMKLYLHDPCGKSARELRIIGMADGFEEIYVESLVPLEEEQVRAEGGH